MIQELIKKPFDEEQFKKYINELHIQTIDTMKDYEKLDEDISFKKIAVDELSDKNKIEVFILKRNKDVKNAKVLFNEYLKKMMAIDTNIGLMAIYYDKDPFIWKLSLVVQEQGNQLTIPKRYTFELGYNIPIKTALTQLSTLNKNSTLKEFLEAFSVDKVTKEFFKEYKELYDTLVEDIFAINKDKKSKEIINDKKAIQNYIKKMLGRIVFLYFVQKKDWLDKNKNFLTELYETSINDNPNINFYDVIMEDLFFKALNVNRKDNDNKIVLGNKEYTIPYLNGGLFIEDEIDKLDISIPNEDFKKILDLFNSYNFTIIEDTPHDSEVAIDPEMLGKIFEKLLNEEERGKKGAFYTPKEIVHYMCQQSIFAYLLNKFNNETSIKELIFSHKIDDYIINNLEDIIKALENIKILDPAIGSGAFPMGMLHELTELLTLLKKEKLKPKILNAKKATEKIEILKNLLTITKNLKRNIIQNSIYGIDIEPSAVEIAKLRFWLSIVVDEDEPTPLPNLFYKIMVGNSLVETIEGLDPLKGKRESTLQELDKLFYEYYNEHENKQGKKNKIIEKLNALFKTLEKKYSNQQKMTLNEKEKKQNEIEIQKANNITATLKEIKEKHYSNKLFLYKLFFRDVLQNGGFDVVIGNPPYIGERKSPIKLKDLYGDLECYQGKLDLWYLFICKGIDILKDEGILSYIAPNNWISTMGALKMRNKLLQETKILEFIHFGDYKVFDSASIQTMILFLQKTKNNQIYTTQYSKLENKKLEKSKLNDFLYKKDNEHFNIYKSYINKKKLLNKNIVFLEESISLICNKIEDNKNFILDKTSEVAQGIVTPNDNVTKKSLQILGDNYQLNEGIFNLTTEEKNNLTFSDEELRLIKPLYTTNEITRYKANKNNQYWVIYTDSSFKNKDKIKPYPNLKNHLDRFKKVITSDNKPYGIHRARKEYFFKGEKILSLRKCVGRPVFTYVDFDSYVNQSFYIIKSERINLKYLTALLNSKLIAFWLKYKGKMQGDNYQIDKEPILDIPIKNINNTKPYEILVDKIMTLKEQGKDTQDLEDKIDSMVYELYGLSDEEIKIIEGNY